MFYTHTVVLLQPRAKKTCQSDDQVRVITILLVSIISQSQVKGIFINVSNQVITNMLTDIL